MQTLQVPIRKAINRYPLLAMTMSDTLPRIPNTVPQCGGTEWWKDGLVVDASGVERRRHVPRYCGYFDTRHPDFHAYAAARNASGIPGAGLYPREDGVYPAAHCRCELEREKTNKVALDTDRERVRTANLPVWADGRERTFGTYLGSTSDFTAPREMMRRWAQGERPHVLMMMGKVGTGKTHLIEAALREAMQRGYWVRYEFTPSLLQRMRDTIGTEAQMAEVLKLARDAEFLALDDIGREQPSDWVREQLGILIESVLQDGSKRLVVSTNHTEAEIAARLGERIASRLFDSNRELVAQVKMPQRDFRRMKS